MAKQVLVIAGSGIGRYVTISGNPSKYGLIDVPHGTIGHTGSSRLMTFTSRPEPTAPHIPLSPLDIPTSDSTDTMKYLSILNAPLKSAPVFINHDEIIPRDSKFIATVEWPLRPGDSRVEAYFIGSNSGKKHWFLMECTIDDLSPHETKYLSRRTIAMVDKGRLKVEEAAVVLLNCAWKYEKETWGTPPFFMASDCGLLDLTTINEIAEKVWPEDKGGEK